jgi:predicted nucleic acid-binding protein
MISRICIDATGALPWILPTPQSLLAESLLKKWDNDGTEFISPPLFDIEITSIIRKYIYLKILSPQQGELAYQLYRDLNVTIMNPPELPMKAWSIAKEYSLAFTYDIQYLALAELTDCELWTADQVLFNKVIDKHNRIHFIGYNTTNSPVIEKKIDIHNTDFPGLWRKF